MVRKAFQRSHCSRGHELTGHNVYYYKRGGRACRACQRLHQRNYKQPHPEPVGTMTEDVAAQVMTALRRGETLNTICKKVRSDRITYRHRYLNDCAAHPDYAEPANELLAQECPGRRRPKRSAKRNKTHRRRGHPLSEGNVYFDRGGSHRKCMICTAINAENPPLPSEDQIRRVTAALNAGQTLSQILRGKGGGEQGRQRII